MKITEVKISLIQPRNGLVAFATIIIEDALRLDFIAVHKKLNADGYRLTFPTKQKGLHQRPVFYPIRQQACEAIERSVFEKLKNVIGLMDAGHGCTYS